MIVSPRRPCDCSLRGGADDAASLAASAKQRIRVCLVMTRFGARMKAGSAQKPPLLGTLWALERRRALRLTPQGPDLLERPTGFEPATSSLGSWHSATELRPPDASYTTLPRDDDCAYLPSL